MKKQIIAAALLALILVGCSSGSGNNKDSSSADTTLSPSETPISTTSPEGDAPSEDSASVESTTEETIPYIPGDVLYSDDNNVGVKAPHGGLFFNGEPVESEFFDILVESNKATSTLPDTIPHEITDNSTTAEKSTSSDTSAVTDTTTTKTPESTTLKDEEKYNLAEYVSTGKTPLNISKVQIFNSSEPGVEDVKYYSPGEIFFINIWCDTLNYMDSEVLLIAKDTKHKDSYSKKEIISSADMLMAQVYAEGQLFVELEIPKNTPKGIYEIRFLCGGEEGYIPFHIG